MSYPFAPTTAAMSRDTTRRVRSYPGYGVDAPAVAAALLGGGVLGIGIAVGTARRPAPWSTSSFGGIGVGAALLGSSMLVYSRLGKQRLRDHLLRQRSWRGDGVVLDVGAGRGLMAIGAAHRAPGGRVAALDVWTTKDLSGNGPSALLRNASLEKVADRLEVVTGDARRLNASDETVDVVVSVFCLHNIEPPAQRLAACLEIARVLRPGGTAMIADFPSVRAYVDTFREAGLTVCGPFRAERIALGVWATSSQAGPPWTHDGRQTSHRRRRQGHRQLGLRRRHDARSPGIRIPVRGCGPQFGRLRASPRSTTRELSP